MYSLTAGLAYSIHPGFGIGVLTPDFRTGVLTLGLRLVYIPQIWNWHTHCGSRIGVLTLVLAGVLVLVLGLVYSSLVQDSCTHPRFRTGVQYSPWAGGWCTYPGYRTGILTLG